MNFFHKSIRFFSRIEDFFLKWVLVIIAFLVPLIVLTPIGEFFGLQFSNTFLIVFLVFCMTYIGAKIIRLLSRKVEEEKSSVQFFSQDEWLDKSIRLIPPKGMPINILIYTSYSIFNKFELLANKNPGLSKSKIKILIRDPDTKGLVPKGLYSNTRRGQVFTALDEFSRYRKKNKNIEIRYYRNEPWVRGMKVGQNMLFYSTYADKKSLIPKTEEQEYSGSFTPWLFINSRENESKEKAFISGFDSLYSLIWNKCTKYKNIIFDLDGTLFYDENLSDFLENKIPNMFIKHICEKNDASNKVDLVMKEYLKLRQSELSGTESLIMSTNKALNISNVNIGDYIKWKDSQISNFPINLQFNKKLKNAIEVISKTYNIYLLTNHTNKFTKIALQKLKLNQLFLEENILTIDKTEVPKPSVKLIEIMIRNWGIVMQDSIFIGDRKHVDLSYIQDICLAGVLIKDVEYLSDFLEQLYLPISMLKEKQLYNTNKATII